MLRNYPPEIGINEVKQVLVLEGLDDTQSPLGAGHGGQEVVGHLPLVVVVVALDGAAQVLHTVVLASAASYVEEPLVAVLDFLEYRAVLGEANA